MAKPKAKSGAKQPAKPAQPAKAATRANAAPRAKLAKAAPGAKLAKAAPRAQPAKPAAPRAQLAKPPASAAAAAPEQPAPAARAPIAAQVDAHGLGWIDAGNGYQLSLDGGKLVARNDKGKQLSAVPKEVRDGAAADQLEALRDWLAEHARECAATVEQWMLRSLPVPRAVLEQVWDDPAWRRPLENAVVVAVGADGEHDHAAAGLFRGVDARKGVGVVDLDGETAWLAADRVALPHPILLRDLDGWRELVTQLGVAQGLAQLHRETHVKPAGLTATSIDQFGDGKFAMLMHAIGKARTLGYKVRGGFAVCKVFDAGAVSEARYWIGADSPDAETYTGALSWVDDRERGLPVAGVGPVAFSEGMRMASAIYAARVVAKPEQAS